MSNREKLINLQRRFEKDARYFADKEDYTSFEKVVEDFIVEAGKINPDINTKDLLSRHLSKASKVKSYSDALQVMNSVSSDITILSMDLHGKGEPIYTASEYNKLVRDNNIEYTKNSFEIFKKSFDLLKKNNSDRLHKIDDLRNLYLGNVKNYKDKIFKFPHLVDTEQRKLFDTLKDIITKQIFDTFEKDREILLSYLSERAEKLIKRLIKDFSIEGKEEKYYPGYHFLNKMEFEFDQIGFKIKNRIEDGNAGILQRDIPGLVDISAGLIERKYIDVIYERKEEIHEEIDKAVEEYNKILGSKDNLMKGIAFRSKYEIDSLVNDSINKVKNEFKKIRTSLSTDLKQMYTEDSTLENIKKYQDSRNHHLWVDGVVERMEKFILDLLNRTLVPKIREIFNELSFEFGISPAQVRDDITNWWRKIEFGNKLILKKYLRSGMGDQFDLFIKRKYRRLKPNEIGLSQVIEFVKGEYEAYSMEFNNMVVEILNGYDVTYSRYSKFKDISDTARKLSKDFQREKWVYRSFFVKHNNMIEECIEDFLSAYQEGDYHNERWSYPYDDWYKDRNFYRIVEVELSNAYYRSVKDHEISGRFRYKGYSTVMDEAEGISESRRNTFFEAEEEKKPKISKEEKEKLKAQLDNFFADKKEAKATELKKSIADRDKAIEDVILKYSTEKENIQREYSKNIQAAKSEAEANKLRAERDEELQRLSLEKATSIEDLKERQKKEEASIREKYQTLFDKKLEEYKDSIGDAIGDFAKDIERGIEGGIKSNPIFQ